jgi:hypothetical protein
MYWFWQKVNGWIWTIWQCRQIGPVDKPGGSRCHIRTLSPGSGCRSSSDWSSKRHSCRTAGHRVGWGSYTECIWKRGPHMKHLQFLLMQSNSAYQIPSFSVRVIRHVAFSANNTFNCLSNNQCVLPGKPTLTLIDGKCINVFFWVYQRSSLVEMFGNGTKYHIGKFSLKCSSIGEYHMVEVE